MKEHEIYLYVFDTMADWEIGYLTAELNSGRYLQKGFYKSKIVTVGTKKIPVTTMGGLTIQPDLELSECSTENVDALILPGGDTWLEAIHEPILTMAENYLREGILVAAICGATFGLAQKGLLNTRKHTSNDLDYLKMICPGYNGEQYYQQESAVTDKNLITASGIAPLEFTVQVLKALGAFSEKTLDSWYHLYKTTHETKYFYELMNSVQE